MIPVAIAIGCGLIFAGICIVITILILASASQNEDMWDDE